MLKVENITKKFGEFEANSGISLDVGSGEIHALLGENGAGKSTLVKIIYGSLQPTKGKISWMGETLKIDNPSQARKIGIGMVFQHFSLFNALNVAENIALGMEDVPKMSELANRIRKVSNDYGLPLDPNRLVGELSAGEQQRVEIIRCLLQNPKLLIMDEPTSVLTPQEVKILFKTLEKLRQEGRSILYISHKLEEIRVLCDRATILRGGKKVDTCIPRDETARAMAEMMVGSTLQIPQKSSDKPGEIVLEVESLNLPSKSAFGTSLKDLNFTVRAGEILGIGGVSGNGQDELTSVLSGETEINPSAIRLSGEPIGDLGPKLRRMRGLQSAPEERLGHAAAPDMSLIENALLSGDVREGLSNRGFIKWKKTRDFARKIISEFDVRTPSEGAAARALSGGNLQKFVMGREILQNPNVLVINQPTWGVDAAAAASIRQALMDLAANGAAIVVISQDLDELMDISSRFSALNEGRLSAPVDTADLTIEDIGLMMGGTSDMVAKGEDA